MFKVQFSSVEFLDDYFAKEIKKIIKNEPIKVTNGCYEVEFKDFKSFSDKVSNMFFFSRALKNAFYIKENSKIDLIGFDLERRDYMLNKSKSFFSPYIGVFLYYYLNLKKKDTILDVIANKGEIGLELLYLFSGKEANVKRRHDLRMIKEFRDFNIKLPKLVSSSKFNMKMVVQSNDDFKYIKENLLRANLKANLSKIDFEWLDVKLDENSYDYIIGNLDLDFDMDFDLDELLYLIEYINSGKICLVSHFKLPLKVIKKYKLKIFDEVVIEYGRKYVITTLIS